MLVGEYIITITLAIFQCFQLKDESLLQTSFYLVNNIASAFFSQHNNEGTFTFDKYETVMVDSTSVMCATVPPSCCNAHTLRLL